MATHRLGFWTLSLLLPFLLPPLSALGPDAKPQLNTMSENQLYKDFEDLNTPQNLALRFVGGEPPRFVQEQIKILAELASRKTPASSKLLLRIADEYLARLHKLDPPAFRVSPLQSLQIPLIQAVAARADQPPFRERLDTFLKSPLIKEYAKARVLVPLTEQKLRAVAPAQDPDGSKRGAIILTELIGDLSFSDCVHIPARVAGVATLTAAVAGRTPPLVWQALASADSVSKRYARDFAFVSACAAPVGDAPRQLEPSEIVRLKEIIDRWIKEYRPLLAKEAYPSDVLGAALRSLAARKGNEDLAKLLPPVEPAPQPPKPAEP